MTWNGALTLACLLLGFYGGLRARTEHSGSAELGELTSTPLQKSEVAISGRSLEAEMAILMGGSGKLAKSSFLQDLLKAGEDTLIGLLNETDVVESPDHASLNGIFRMLIFGRLAELDPEAAWELANRSGDRESAVMMVLAGMLPSESASAIAARIEHRGLRPLRFLWKNHPKKTLETLELLPKGMNAASEVPSMFEYWTNQDSTMAKALLEDLPNAWRHAALDGFVGALLESEPAEALDFLRELAPDELDHCLRSANLKRLIAHDSAAVESFMETLPDGSSRRVLLAEVFAGKLESDKASAVAWLEKRISRFDQEHYLSILFAVDDHPDVLAKLFLKMPESLAKSAVPNAVDAWFKKDPDAANAWVAGLPETLRHPIEQERLYDLANSGTSEPLNQRVDALARIEDSRKRRRALMRLAKHLSQQGETHAQEALATVADEKQGDEVRLAMKWLELEGQSTEIRQDELANIRSPGLQQRWRAWMVGQMGREPAKAVAWLGQQPEAFYNEEAHVVESLARQWSASDPTEASAWIVSLPAGEGKDRAIKQLIYVTNAWEPEAALAWSAEISSDSVRLEEASRLLRQWRKVGEAEAREALAESVGFSDEERARLRLELAPRKEVSHGESRC